MDEREAGLVIACARGVGPVMAGRLLDRFGSYRQVVAAVERGRDVPGEARREILSALESGEAAEELERVRRAGARFAVPGDPDYPSPLREIPGRPIGLFVMGRTVGGLIPGVAIVGTRTPTPRGPSVARRLAAGLVAHGLPVVSGLARGIDTAAHRGALDAGGTTIAVLGTGLDRTYPPENEDLALRIAREGAILSEFPMGSDARAGSFPRRNRIIAGLSAGVVVVEAGERSGALITAARALEQGREVFAVPGPIDEPQSRGPNGLIRDGAKLVEDVADILEELDRSWGPFVPVRPASSATEAGTAGRPSDRSTSDDAPGAAGAAPLGESSEIARRILACLSSTPVTVDELVVRARADTGEVVSVLFELELAGAARSCPGGRYVAGERGRR